ncbi:MAG: hypothetical protein AAF417_15015 [Pseudomonadota bacterium]
MASTCTSCDGDRIGFAGIVDAAGEIALKTCILGEAVWVGILQSDGTEVSFSGYQRQQVQWSNLTESGISRNINRLTFAYPESESPTIDSLGIFTSETGGDRYFRLYLMQNGNILRLPYSAAFPIDLAPKVLAICFSSVEQDGVALSTASSCATCS